MFDFYQGFLQPVLVFWKLKPNKNYFFSNNCFTSCTWNAPNKKNSIQIVYAGLKCWSNAVEKESEQGNPLSILTTLLLNHFSLSQIPLCNFNEFRQLKKSRFYQIKSTNAFSSFVSYYVLQKVGIAKKSRKNTYTVVQRIERPQNFVF